MDARRADPDDGLVKASASRAEVSEDSPPAPVDEGPEGGQGRTPYLTLDGFSGPLERLLSLAQAHQIDLGRVSLGMIVDQLVAALQQAPAVTPLSEKGNWVVMAAWLVQLGSLLLLPAQAPARLAAEAEADQLRSRLNDLRAMQALAGWLGQRPQLGHDVFARGQPEVFNVSVEAGEALDGIEFLWASLALFEDDTAKPETTPLYRPLHLDLYVVTEARERIRQRLTEIPQGLSLDRLLPDELDHAHGEPRKALRRRSAWSSTFIASLELAKQGDVALAQAAFLDPIHVQAVSTAAAGGDSDQPGSAC